MNNSSLLCVSSLIAALTIAVQTLDAAEKEPAQKHTLSAGEHTPKAMKARKGFMKTSAQTLR